MSHDEMRRYFEAVLTMPPQDRTDLDAAIATAQRQRRRRLSAYASGGVACTLLVGALAFTAWPQGPRTQDLATSPAPSASPSQTSEPEPTALGARVTAPAQLDGVWRTVALTGVTISHPDDRGFDYLHVRFQERDGKFAWSANDTCNDQFGSFTVADGRFSTKGSGSTLVGCSPSPTRELNPAVVKEADEAWIAPATESEPRHLYLMSAGKVIGVYAYQPMGNIHGTFELTGGGNAPHTPAHIEDLELRDDKRTVVSTNTDGHGVFDIEAPAGDYFLVTARGCPAPVAVRIADRETTEITITCKLR